jgi:hypothetical protein
MGKKPDRRELCEEVLKLTRKIAPDVDTIEARKEQLRGISEETGEGFSEELEKLGTVEVTAAKAKRFKGIVPTLIPEAFVALPEARQKTLIADGLVEMVNEYTREAKPSVTVRL